MTCTPPAVNKTGRYPMGEAAKLLGVSRQTLWRMCNTMRVKVIYQRRTYRKLFTGDEILRIWSLQA